MGTLKNGLYFAPDDGGAGGSGEADGEENQGEQADVLEWETWHGSQTPEAQKLVAGHVSGLKTALGSERDARDKAESDLRAVAKELEDGSKAQKEVLRLADDNAAISAKADFYEDAHKSGVTNLKLAYLVAKDDDLFDKRGNVNFEKMKEANPELFGRKVIPDVGAGDGTGSRDMPKKVDMNSMIRKKAGR